MNATPAVDSPPRTHLDGAGSVNAILEHAFAQPGPVSFTNLERNGVIIGGMVIVRSERNYAYVKAVIEAAIRRTNQQ